MRLHSEIQLLCSIPRRPELIAVLILIATIDQQLSAQLVSGPSKPSLPKEPDTARWMQSLPDTLLLSELSIPGTHDSCALHDGFAFGFAKCQTWPLREQLRRGIRFIDIRCRRIKDRFQIYHGIVDQRKSFTEVRDDCRWFLDDHPSECVVMSIKEEGKPLGESRPFLTIFQDLIKLDGNLWYLKKDIPRMGDVRGRIIVVDRIGGLGGIRWDSLFIQDDYQASVEKKIRLMQQHFRKAADDQRKNWFLNFCSGTMPSKLLTPLKYSMKTNAVVSRFVESGDGVSATKLGTVIADFPDDEFIQTIIDANPGRRPGKHKISPEQEQ